MSELVPFDSERWDWNAEERRLEQHLGRDAIFLRGGLGTVAAGLLDGTWRVEDAEGFEWFWVLPLPPARRGRERARDRGVRDLRRLGRAGELENLEGVDVEL